MVIILHSRRTVAGPPWSKVAPLGPPKPGQGWTGTAARIALCGLLGGLAASPGLGFAVQVEGGQGSRLRDRAAAPALTPWNAPMLRQGVQGTLYPLRSRRVASKTRRRQLLPLLFVCRAGCNPAPRRGR